MPGLEQMIAELNAFESFDARTAQIAAPKLQEAVRSQARAGLDPNGKPWPLKKDGSRALVNAAAHVRAIAVGPRVDLIVDGPEYFHQTVKPDGTLPQRKIIPSVGDALPPALQAALDEASSEALRGGGAQ